MSEGKVVISTELDSTQLEKDLTKLPKKIKEKTSDVTIGASLDSSKVESDLAKLQTEISQTEDIEIKATIDDTQIKAAQQSSKGLGTEFKTLGNETTVLNSKMQTSQSQFAKYGGEIQKGKGYANSYERQLQQLSQQLGGEVPEATRKAYEDMAKLNQEIRSAKNNYGAYSTEVTNAKNALNNYALSLDDTTFKQVYMRSQLGLTDQQLTQQANSILLASRMAKLMGSQTEILTKQMEGLASKGIKPKDMLPASTIGQFKLLNETMAAGTSPLNKLSALHRGLGESMENNIKKYSAQKIAVAASGGDMVKYGLLLRGITAGLAGMTLAFPLVALAALAFYASIFKGAIESDEQLKALAGTVKSELAEAFKPVIQAAGDFLKVILPIISAIARFAISFNESHPYIAKLVAIILLLIPAITLLLLPLSLGVGLFNGWMIALNSLWVIIGPIITVIGTASATALIFAGVIGVVIVAIIYLWNTNEGFRNAIIGAWNVIKEAAIAIWGGIATFFTETIPNAFNAVIDFFKNNWQNLLLFLVNPFAGAFKVLYSNCDSFLTYIDTFVKNVQDFFTKGWTAIATFFTQTIPTFFTNLWITITTAFTNGWNIISTFFTSTVPTFFSNLWVSISSAFTTGWNNVVSFFTVSIPAWIESVRVWFSELPNKIGYALGFALGAIVKWGVDIYTWVITTVPQWIESISTFWGELPGKISVWLTNVITNITEWGNNIATWITTNVSAWITSIVTFWSELPGKIQKYITEVVTNLTTWSTDVKKWIVTNVTAWIDSIVAYFSELGTKIWVWLVDVVTKMTTWALNITTWITTNVPLWISSITTFFSELPGKIWTWLVQCVTDITTWGGNMLKKAKEGIQKVYDGIVDIVDGLPGKMLEIGGQLVAGMWEGIKNSADWLMDKITDFADGIIEGFEDAFDINSPSRIMRDLIGTNIVKGIGVGVELETPNLETDIDNTVARLTNKLQATVGYETARTTASIASSANKAAGTSTSTSTTTNDNAINLYIDKVDATSTQDIEQLSQELAFYTKRQTI